MNLHRRHEPQASPTYPHHHAWTCRGHSLYTCALMTHVFMHLEMTQICRVWAPLFVHVGIEPQQDVLTCDIALLSLHEKEGPLDGLIHKITGPFLTDYWNFWSSFSMFIPIMCFLSLQWMGWNLHQFFSPFPKWFHVDARECNVPIKYVVTIHQKGCTTIEGTLRSTFWPFFL